MKTNFEVSVYLADLPEFMGLIEALARNVDQLPEEVKKELEMLLLCKRQRLDS